MLKGIHLTLLIGPVVPMPAPKVLMDTLTSVQVTNSKDRSGFQIVFTVGKNSPVLTSMLPAGFFDPITTRVIIIVTLNGKPQSIMDGLITNHEFVPSNEPGKTILSLTGEDLSLAMDLAQLVTPFPAMPSVAKINLCLAPYLALGIVPLVIPPAISPIKAPSSGWDTQNKTTHKQLIKNLAQKVGYIFVVEPTPIPGVNVAYFGPDVNLPVPQAAVSINLDGNSNVEALNFSLNGLAKTIRLYTLYDPLTKKIPIPLPLPNINFLKPPLGARLTPPAKFEMETEAAHLDVGHALEKVFGYMMNNSTAVSGNGSLDVMRYGGLIRARMLVGVRGAGLTYDGLYYVDSVTHNIKKGEYKQSFTLSRDGVVSAQPFLPVQHTF